MPHRMQYVSETSSYIHNLERVDTHDTAKQLASRVPEATEQMLDAASEAVRKMEEARRALSYYACVLDELARDYPDAVTRLPDLQQRLVYTIGSLTSPPTKAKLSLVPQLFGEEIPSKE